MRILYFGRVRERIGTGEETLDPPADLATVGALADWLGGRSAGHAEALGDRSRLRVAVDQSFATFDAPLANAREIAFFPPVTGG